MSKQTNKKQLKNKVMKTLTTNTTNNNTLVAVNKPVFGLADFWNIERMRRVRSPRRNLN